MKGGSSNCSQQHPIGHCIRGKREGGRKGGFILCGFQLQSIVGHSERGRLKVKPPSVHERDGEG